MCSAGRLCWPTVMGYLRIVTHPGILPRPLSPADATHNIAQLLARAHVRTPGEEGGFWDRSRRTAGAHARGNEMPDAPLAALMRQHGVGVICERQFVHRYDRGSQLCPRARLSEAADQIGPAQR